MAKTFIYGVPHGFDFYEKDAEFNDYFKGFYISSRRGRRLMINRRDNGETIYSYLRYGLKEVDRQPLHSFFGMSLVIDNYQFCPNFKVLLEWFDYLFNKLVNEHNVIKINDDGVLHYVIHKFDENSSDIEWLKSNLPNILTQAGQTEIVNYDTSFADGKAGQVVSFNQPVGENRLLETFKKYRWISVSSEIVEKEENSTVFTDPGTIELNYEELNRKLNEFNQQLLPIAVDISKGSYADLKRMSDEVQEINSSLAKYIPSIDDQEEKEKFTGLERKYDSLKDSIRTLMSKMVSSTGPIIIEKPKNETQFCFSCKQNKPLSHFRSSDATKCLECEERDRQKNVIGTNVSRGYKICISCGKKKSIRYFNQKGTDICDDCVKKQEKKPVPVQDSSFDKLGKLIMSKTFLGILASIAIIAVIALVIDLPNGCSSLNVAGEDRETTDTTDVNVAQTGEAVDKEELERLLLSGDFKRVYEYVKDKKDASSYKTSLKENVFQYLKSIVETPKLTKEKVLESIETFYVDNFQFLDFINYGAQDKEYWEQFTDDYFYVWDLIKKAKITQVEKDKGNGILAKYTGLFPEDWMSLLANVKVETPTPVVKTNTDEKLRTTAPGTISVSYTSKDNKPVNEIITGHREIFIKAGTLATFNYPNGSIKTKEEVSKKKNGKMNKRSLQPGSQIVVYCGEIGITITPVKESRFEE